VNKRSKNFHLLGALALGLPNFPKSRSFWFFFSKKNRFLAPCLVVMRNPLSRWSKTCHNLFIMRFHASCAARMGEGGFDAVLLLGTSGSGKSDLLLRLIDRGWALVADDQVIV
jgi:hypothetical protein